MATIFATRGVLRRSDNTKIVFDRGSAPDTAGVAYDAPPNPLVGWGRDTLSPFPIPLDAFGVSTPSELKVWFGLEWSPRAFQRAIDEVRKSAEM